MFMRVAKCYSDDNAHAQRIYDYISNMWFMPATPVLSNGGAKRGLPISCFLNTVQDSLDGILSTWGENVWLASNGGGIGTYWGGEVYWRNCKEIWPNFRYNTFRKSYGFINACYFSGVFEKRIRGLLP